MNKTKIKKLPVKLENKLLRIISFYNEKCVKWNDVGDGFVIYDLDYFTNIILPSYFRVKKFSSFVRRLIKYDFILNKTRHNESYIYEFKHPKFIKHIKTDTDSMIQTNDFSYSDIRYYESIKNENIMLKNKIKEREEEIDTLKRKCDEMEEMIKSRTVESESFYIHDIYSAY